MISCNLENEQIKLLYDLYPNHVITDKMKNVQKDNTFIFTDEDYCDFILFVDDAIIEKGMVNQDYLTETGVKLQFIYDSLHAQSEERELNN